MKAAQMKYARSFLLSIFFVGMCFAASATDYYLKTGSATSPQTASSWNTDPTGAGSGTNASNFTTIGDKFIVGVNATLNATASLVIETGVTLQINSGFTFTIAGNNNADPVLTINGTVDLNNASSSSIIVSTTSGNKSTSNTFILNSGATLITSNTNGIAGTNCGLPFTGTSGKGTVTLNTGANFIFDGATQATLGMPSNVNDVTISSSGTTTLSAATVLTGILTLNSGTFATSTRLTPAANAEIVSAGGSMTGTLQGANVYDLSFTGTTRTAETASSTGAGLRNVTINLTSGNTLTRASNMTPDGDLTITSGTLALSTFTANRSASGGILSVASGASLQIGGTNSLPSNYSTYTLSGTVEYNGTGTQTIAAVTYTNLTSSNTGSRTLANSGVINISGTFTPGANSYTVTGSTIDFNGTTQTIPTLSGGYNNLTLSTSGTKTASGNITVNSVLTVASGVTFDLATYQLIGSSLTTSGTGTLKTSNTSTSALPSGRTWSMDVQFVASANQHIAAGTYSGNLKIQGSNTTKFILGNVSTSSLELTSGVIVLTTIGGTPYTLSVSSQIIRSVSGGTVDGVNDGILEFTNTAASLTVPQGTFGAAGINNIKISGGRSVLLASDFGNLSIEKLTTTGTGSYFDLNGWTLTITNSVSMSSGNGIKGSSAGSSLVIGSGITTVNLGTLFFDQSSSGVTNSLYNITIGTTGGGSVTLGNTLTIRNTFQPPTSGTFAFNSNGNLVIASRSTYTGRVYTINNGFTFGGNVIIERFIKNKTARRYIFLASPVDGISIRNGWQDDIYITSPASGGIPCTDTLNKYNDSGYDATTRKLVTIFKYNQAAKKWDSVVSHTTSTYLEKGVGYRVYYRGSRKADSTVCSAVLESNNGGTPDSTIMNVYGTPTNGDVTVGIYGKGTNANYGYTLLGNPYACELDFATFASNNSPAISPSYWTHDPQSSSTTGYLTYNNGTVTGVGTKNSGIITSGNGRYIASGQGFFVQSSLSGNANAGTVTFKEVYKAASQQLGVFRGANNQSWDNRIRISFLESDSTAVDDVVIRFSDEPTVTTGPNDYWDAPTLNTTKYIGTIKSNRTFAIQTRPLNFYNDTVMIRIVSNNAGNHLLNFTEFADFTAADQIILLDLFTGTQSNVKANPYYSFNITSNSASQGGRFLLVFRSKSSVMPVSFLNIAATQKPEGAEVKWKVAFEQNIENYNVQRSDNGRDFTTIATVNSKGNSNTAVEYAYIDAKPMNGTVYYRVSSNEKSGDVKYSAIVKLNSSKETLIMLYPNPVKDNLQIQLLNPAAFKRATILVRNVQGRTVMQQVLAVTGNNINLNVSSLANGMYVITLVNERGESLIDKFIKN